MRISFTIPGRIKGWQRARYNSKTGAVFNSADLQTSQALIKDFANRAMGLCNPMDGAIKLDVQIFIGRPKSHTGKKRVTYVSSFPDTDNLLKTIGDSLNHIVWHDDRQIADTHLVRIYTDGQESVCVTVESLEEML